MPAADFEDFIDRLGLRYFAGRELLIGLERGNEQLPAMMRPNMVPTLIVADALRHEMGDPLMISNA